MNSISYTSRVLVPQWSFYTKKTKMVLNFVQSKRKINFIPRVVSSSSNDNDSSLSLPKQNQLGYDPSDELLGVDLNPRNKSVEPRSWFGPNGQYIRELPCPSCRGRGYTPCKECGIERPRSDCEQCNGNGLMTCHQCLGDCVIWEESIDERPWEKARSISPLRVKEDDEVDNLDIKLNTKRKSKRIYKSPSPEVGQKISRSLKSLNAKTGLFSKRMKIIHSDPALRAQRAAAIKKAKGTDAARKHASEVLIAFFSDPENRRKRSIAMKGVKFDCKNCGREGHRRNYCPELDSSTDKRFQCSACGEKGHNRRTCLRSRSSSPEHNLGGHNLRMYSELVTVKCSMMSRGRRVYACRLCREKGHNFRTCPNRVEQD